MKVALVHDWLTGMRGGEKVLAEIGSLFPEAEIFTLFHFPGSVSEAIESHLIHTSLLQHAPFLHRRYRYYLPLFPRAIESLDLSGFDLVISSSHCVAKGAIAPPGVPHLCYCHTPMRYAYDRFGDYFPANGSLRNRLIAALMPRLRAWDRATAGRPHAYIANSRHVAERIQTHYGRPAQVIHPPVDHEFFSPGPPGRAALPYLDRGPYLLVVSAFAPYKRIDLAIRAAEKRELQLVIAGSGPEEENLRRLAGKHTRFAGAVTDETLRELYRGASALLLPGEEDFGITPLEAMACGTPVVALARGGVLDTVEDGRTGVLYSGTDPESLLKAVDRAAEIRFNPEDLRNHSGLFSRPRFQREFSEVVAAFMGGSKAEPVLPQTR